jgi:3-hydroxybutyryl-CoA dehydratase
MLSETLSTVRFNVDRAAIRRYADITHDYNPIHLDPEFAAKTPMGGIIAHGMLSLSLIWQSLSESFEPDELSNIVLDVRFVRPVRENDWIESGGILKDARGVYEVWVRAESPGRQELVISGTATLAAVSDMPTLSPKTEMNS